MCASCVAQKASEDIVIGTVMITSLRVTTQCQSTQHTFSHFILSKPLWWRDITLPAVWIRNLRPIELRECGVGHRAEW